MAGGIIGIMHNITTIVGPTGTGKSRLGLSLAQKYGGIILSADSRQVFKYADVGTNKYPLSKSEISTLERLDDRWVVNGIDIYGYDLVFPDEPFSVADFVQYGNNLLSNLSNETQIYIVGGTGFYIDTFLGDMPYSTVKPDPKLRNDLSTFSIDQLRSRLSSLDSAFALKMNESDSNNPQRLIRYIELDTHDGSVKEAKRYSPLKETISPIKIGLTTDRDELDQRVKRWIDRITGGDLQTEVAQLLSMGYDDTPLLTGIIYQPMVDFLQEEADLEVVKNEIVTQVKQYIRRQLTWFKRDKNVYWFDVSKESFDHQVYKLLESNVEG